jgi:hypothetical protein
VSRASAAAAAVDELIASLPEAVAAAVTQARPRLIDRSLHRDEHLDEIEATLASP